jgi:cytochrome c553
LILQRWIIKFSLIAVIFSVALSGQAADLKAGKEKSSSCQGCHGTDGNSINPQWPSLASQHSGYLIKQINDFQSAKRKDALMNSMVAGLSKTDVADIVAYFSSMKIKTASGSDDHKTIAIGEKIFKGGNSYNGVPACSACHGPNGVGNGPSKFPYLAGQQMEYLIKTMNDFKSGARNNDPNEMMRNIAEKMSENEIKSVSIYIANM